MTTPQLVAARELFAVIDEAAGDDLTLPRRTVEALVGAGLHAVITPRAVGGTELALTDAIDVYAEVARADGSAGWCVMASATITAFFGAWGGDDFVAEVFADGVPLAAGQFAPNGIAVPDGDGWRVSGDYQFGSGIADATWVGAGAITQPPDGADPAFLLALFPARCATPKGNWDVLGLRATASWDYEVRDVPVSLGSTFEFFAPVRHRGGPVYDLGVLGITAAGHAGFAIGVTRRVLDELVAVATTKHRMGAVSPLRESERFLHELGNLEGRARAARAWVHEAFAEAQAAAEAGSATPHHVNALRQATVHVTQEGAAIARDAYLLAGTTALRDGPLQRAFRDLHAGSQHFFASPAAAADFARDLLSEADAGA